METLLSGLKEDLDELKSLSGTKASFSLPVSKRGILQKMSSQIRNIQKLFPIVNGVSRYL